MRCEPRASADCPSRSELTVTGYDDIPEAAEPGLTTVSQPLIDKGRIAGELYLSHRPGSPPRRRILPTHVQVRATSGPPTDLNHPMSAKPAIPDQRRGAGIDSACSLPWAPAHCQVGPWSGTSVCSSGTDGHHITGIELRCFCQLLRAAGQGTGYRQADRAVGHECRSMTGAMKTTRRPLDSLLRSTGTGTAASTPTAPPATASVNTARRRRRYAKVVEDAVPHVATRGERPLGRVLYASRFSPTLQSHASPGLLRVYANAASYSWVRHLRNGTLTVTAGGQTVITRLLPRSIDPCVGRRDRPRSRGVGKAFCPAT